MMLMLSVILALSCCRHFLVEQVTRLRVPAFIPHRNFWLNNVIFLFIMVLIICCVQKLTKIMLKYKLSCFFSNELFANLIFHIWLSWFIGIHAGKDTPSSGNFSIITSKSEKYCDHRVISIHLFNCRCDFCQP